LGTGEVWSPARSLLPPEREREHQEKFLADLRRETHQNPVWRKIQFLADGFEEKNYYFSGMHGTAGERERE
jgi:hypothetical protein